MRAWLRCLRVANCIFVSLLAVIAFKIAQVDMLWTAVVAVFFIATATMLQNDWRDRIHDLLKGKTLALEQGELFVVWLLAFWVVSGSLIMVAAIQNGGVGFMLALLALVGAVYSETRRIPLLPITVVSLASASPAALPLATGASLEKLWPLILSAVFIIFAREIINDLDDLHIDLGYKSTLPLFLGEPHAKIFVAVAVAAGVIAAGYVSLAVLPGASLAIIGVVLLLCGAGPRISRKCLDVGVVIVLITLLLWG